MDTTSMPLTQEHTMTRTLIAAIALVAASSAFAESPVVDNTPFVAGKARAEVQAELQQSKAAGANPWSTSFNQLRGFQSTTTRAAVTGEFLQSRGQTAALTGEDSGSAYLSTRTHVVAGRIVAGEAVNAQ
jgi:Domain of unknown function (DUF4148)